MCTALSICMGAHYFGRNLGLDRSYGEEVCVMPRRFPLRLNKLYKKA
ncbi:MAG: linear amide C-N hydrolase [Oscillospiraceae bacterium]